MAVVMLLVEDSASLDFLIRHKSSGKYVHPYYSDVEIPNNDELVLYHGFQDHIHMTFDIVENEWGYIRHVESGKVFHPYYGLTEDNTHVVLHSDHQPWALFAFDQVNNHIVHRESGKFIHPYWGESNPNDNTPLVLHHDINANMEFTLVDLNGPTEEVFPYGDAEIIGEWKLVFSVENSLATHTETYEVTLGKSETESETASIKFAWESNASAQMLFAQMSTSASLSNEIQQSSSETWTVEAKKTDSIEVVAGQTVATWQKCFIGRNLGHTAVHQSPMLADTEGPHIKPGESANTKYRFI